MQKSNYQPQNLLAALLSFEMAAAAMGMAFFWFTIVSFDADSVASKSTTNSDEEDVMAEVNSSKPMELANSGKTVEALSEAKILVQKQPNDAAANIAAGNIYIMSGADDEGLRYLKKGVTLSKRDPDVLMNYARKLAQTKHTDDAIAQYEIAAKMDPEDAGPRTEMAKIYLDSDRPDEAADQLKSLLDANPHNFAARKLRGIALARAGKSRQGLDEYMMGMTAENQSGPPDALKSLLGGQGQAAMDRVIYELQKQVAERPTEYQPKLRLAQLYTYGNNPRAAKQLLVDARKLAPTNAEIQRTLAVVQKQLGDDNQAMNSFSLSVKLEQDKEAGREQQ